MVQTLRKTVCKCLKKLKIELLYDPAIPLQDIYLEGKNPSNSKRHVHLSVYSSTIYNSQGMETTQEPSAPQQTIDLRRCGI